MNYAAFERLCKDNDTTPTAISLKLGLKKGNTTSWKNGGNPSVDILIKLAVELDCSTDYLLGLDDVPNRRGIKLNKAENLKKDIDEALIHLQDYQKDTISCFSDDDKLKKLARLVSEDTFRCFSEFEKAILKAFSE